MMKTFSKPGIEENFFNLIKGIHKNPIANIIFNGGKNACFHPKIANKERVFTHMTPIQYHTRQPIPGNKNKNKKGIETGKEETKLSLIYGLYECLLRKPQGNLQKTKTRTNK